MIKKEAITTKTKLDIGDITLEVLHWNANIFHESFPTEHVTSGSPTQISCFRISAFVKDVGQQNTGNLEME